MGRNKPIISLFLCTACFFIACQARSFPVTVSDEKTYDVIRVSRSQGLIPGSSHKGYHIWVDYYSNTISYLESQKEAYQLAKWAEGTARQHGDSIIVIQQNFTPLTRWIPLRFFRGRTFNLMDLSDLPMWERLQVKGSCFTISSSGKVDSRDSILIDALFHAVQLLPTPYSDSDSSRMVLYPWSHALGFPEDNGFWTLDSANSIVDLVRESESERVVIQLHFIDFEPSGFAEVFDNTNMNKGRYAGEVSTRRIHCPEYNP